MDRFPVEIAKIIHDYNNYDPLSLLRYELESRWTYGTTQAKRMDSRVSRAIYFEFKDNERFMIFDSVGVRLVDRIVVEALQGDVTISQLHYFLYLRDHISDAVVDLQFLHPDIWNEIQMLDLIEV